MRITQIVVQTKTENIAVTRENDRWNLSFAKTGFSLCGNLNNVSDHLATLEFQDLTDGKLPMTAYELEIVDHLSQRISGILLQLS